MAEGPGDTKDLLYPVLYNKICPIVLTYILSYPTVSPALFPDVVWRMDVSEVKGNRRIEDGRISWFQDY